MALTWKSFIDKFEYAGLWDKLKPQYKQFPDALIADIERVGNPRLSDLDVCVVKGCMVKFGRNYHVHLGTQHGVKRPTCANYCKHCSALKTMLYQYVAYCKLKFSKMAAHSLSKIFVNFGFAQKDHRRIMSVLEHVGQFQSFVVTSRMFGQPSAGVNFTRAGVDPSLADVDLPPAKVDLPHAVDDPPPAGVDIHPPEDNHPPAKVDLPHAVDDLPPAGVDTHPAEVYLPPAKVDLPHAVDDLPPAGVDIHPAEVYLPPAEADIPPAEADIPPAEADIPPAEADIPPTEVVLLLTEDDHPSAKVDFLSADIDLPPADVKLPTSLTDVLLLNANHVPKPAFTTTLEDFLTATPRKQIFRQRPLLAATPSFHQPNNSTNNKCPMIPQKKRLASEDGPLLPATSSCHKPDNSTSRKRHVTPQKRRLATGNGKLYIIENTAVANQPPLSPSRPDVQQVRNNPQKPTATKTPLHEDLPLSKILATGEDNMSIQDIVKTSQLLMEMQKQLLQMYTITPNRYLHNILQVVTENMKEITAKHASCIGTYKV